MKKLNTLEKETLVSFTNLNLEAFKKHLESSSDIRISKYKHLFSYKVTESNYFEDVNFTFINIDMTAEDSPNYVMDLLQLSMAINELVNLKELTAKPLNLI